MKHLLSGLPSLKISSKAENEAIRRMLEGNFEDDDDLSPIADDIDRPKLPLSLQMQLRDACEALVEDTGNADKESTGNTDFEILMGKSKTTRSHSRPRTGKKSGSNKHDSKAEPLPEWKDMPVKLGLEPPKDHADNDDENATKEKRKSIKEKAPLTRLDTSIKVPEVPKEADAAAPSHSSNTSESVIMSASTDNNPLTASTGLTSAGFSPVTKPIEPVTQPKRDPIDNPNDLPFGVVSVTRPKTATQEPTPPTDTKTKRESIGATLKNLVRRKRSSTITKSQQDQQTERPVSSGNVVLRRFSLRKHKSMSHLPQDHNEAADEYVPPVPKLADATIRYSKVELARMADAKPVDKLSIIKPATPVSIQSTRANVVEVPRSTKRSVSKIDNSSTPNLTSQERRKPSVAGSSVDSCFTPPIPQTPDRQGQIAAALGHRPQGGGSIDIKKATKSLENLRAHQNRPSTSSASFPAVPGFDLPMPAFGSAFSTDLPSFHSRSSSRPDSRGITTASIAATSVHSSRAPSRGGFKPPPQVPTAQQQSRGAMLPPPPVAPKYSIMPSAVSYQKQIDRDREQTKSPSQQQQSVPTRPSSSHRASSGPRQMFHPLCMNPTGPSPLSNLSSTNSSVVHLPGQPLSRSGTFPSETGSLAPVSRSNTFSTAHISKSHYDLPSSTSAKLDQSSNFPVNNLNPSSATSRRQTVTSTFLGLPMDAPSSAATSSRNSTINFSRKFTAPEDEGWKRDSLIMEPEITALPPVPKPTKRGGLRRVLSSFSVLKTRKVAA